MTTRNKGSTENVLSKHISTMTVALTKDLSAYDNVVIVKPNDTDALYAKYKKTGTGGTASTLTDLGFNDLDGNIWQIVISTELTPMHFGAIGNGVTNDAVALNKAFKSGADIDLASRNYAFSGTLSVNASGTKVSNGTLTCSSVTGLNADGDIIVINNGSVTFDSVKIIDSVNSSSVNRMIGIVGDSFRIKDCFLQNTYKIGIEIRDSNADYFLIENVRHVNSRTTCTYNFYNSYTTVNKGVIVGGIYDSRIHSVAPLSGNVVDGVSVQNIKMDISLTVSGLSGVFSRVSGCDIYSTSSSSLFYNFTPYLFQNNNVRCNTAGSLNCLTSVSNNFFDVNSMSMQGAFSGNVFNMWTNNSAGYTLNSVGTSFSNNTFLATTSGALLTVSGACSETLLIGNTAYGTITNFINNSGAGSAVTLANNYKNGVLES